MKKTAHQQRESTVRHVPHAVLCVTRLCAFVLLLITLIQPVAPVFAAATSTEAVPDDEVTAPDHESPPGVEVEVSEDVSEVQSQPEPAEAVVEESGGMEPEETTEVFDEQTATNTVNVDGAEGVVQQEVDEYEDMADEAASTTSSVSTSTEVAQVTVPPQPASTSVATKVAATTSVTKATSTVDGDGVGTTTDTQSTRTTSDTADVAESGSGGTGEDAVVRTATSTASTTATLTATTSPPVLPESDSISVPVSGSEVTVDDAPALSDTGVSTDVAGTEASTSTLESEVLGATSTYSHITTNDENLFSFSKNECVSVGDGSFYCTEIDTTPSSGPLGADRVFAAADGDGDREIYIETQGMVTQVTQNSTDDDAPYYDPVSGTITWHRLIDGRYQIISYDLGSETETQLTNERYNNMQPTQSGDVLLWQGWVGNDWEIMMQDGDTFTMLTDNTVHDIAPSINGNYITWQSFEDDHWRVKVYDLLTGTTETIGAGDSGSVQNPRFVLVYDTELANGDIETKGYDLKERTVVPLSATPAHVPQDLPDPEPTDEERALVQPVVQIKTKSEHEDDADAEDLFPRVGADPEANTPAAHTATTTDMIVAPYDAGEKATSTEPIVADLVIPATRVAEATSTATVVSSPQATSTAPVTDLVIPPMVENASLSDDRPDDSQQVVATST